MAHRSSGGNCRLLPAAALAIYFFCRRARYDRQRITSTQARVTAAALLPQPISSKRGCSRSPDKVRLDSCLFELASLERFGEAHDAYRHASH